MAELAKHVGKPWATGASAVLQYDNQGREQAWAIVLLEGFPISAVATEHMALLLCILMAYEAQTGRCVLEEVGEETAPSEEQMEDRRAEWHGRSRSMQIAWLSSMQPGSLAPH